MKIAFYNIFGEMKNAEQETLMRLNYVFSKQGHELIIVDRNGYVVSECAEKGSYVEGIHIDFMFTYNTLDFALATFPDVFSVFCHWSPIGFVANFQSILSIKMFNLYDHFACFYEQDVFQRAAQISTGNIVPIGSSVPKDYIVPSRKQKERKLFYVGVNFERALRNMRYGELLKELDGTGILEIYGPRKVYGKVNLWSGFDSYKGEIPFDGHTIIEKINQAGVCLALNSPMHNDADAVSNRTFEAAAAGAVIISDDNKFVHNYFGDSVFYIERDLSEKEASKKILKILDWVNKNPKEAYDMACRSQQVFIEHLTLDKMVTNFVENTKDAITKVHNVALQTDVIDIICFIDEVEDYPKILSQIERQFYQNLHLIFVALPEVYKKLEINMAHDFIPADKEFKGRSFLRASECLQGRYFMFVDRYSILHARHVYKNHEIISGREELFAYSGCYMKTSALGAKKYIVLNNKPILRDEFLLFSNVSNENIDWHYRDRQCFFIETIFSRSAAIFDRKILDLTTGEELFTISDAIHYYLACCSLIKNNQLGRFTNALTTGYQGNCTEEIEKTVFGKSRKHWISNGRSAKTYIKEMNEIFYKYTFESNPANILPRNFSGEITWYDEILATPIHQPVSKKRKFVRLLKKLIPRRVKDFIKKIVFA